MNITAPIQAYFSRHLQVALNSLGRLYQTPFASLMTAAVLGIAIALPSGLYLLADNLQRLSNQWDSSADISLFLNKSITEKNAQQLQKKLLAWPEIASIELITPLQALEEFREYSGFGEVLDNMDENPLPTVLAIQPEKGFSDSNHAADLLARLQVLRGVELAQLDLEWVKRFDAIIKIIHRSIWLMASLLGLAVLLIVGNTIRLEILNRHKEIQITRLIGATNGFVRRPFLYTGFWYGLIGAFIGGVVVLLSFWLLNKPVDQLSQLYQSDFEIQLLGFTQVLALLSGGAILGLAGAWLAVSRHLAATDPN